MLQLIYASAAVKPFTPEALKVLLAKARAKNSAAGITGMLLYHAGSFLQALEGPNDAVASLFKVIEKDPRHTTVRLLFRD
ncbi:MAG: BLUF domain-containing protein, partial [Rhodospirillaceae bacterium]